METAVEILDEIFGVRAVEVEEMIQRRMEERSWETERMHPAEDGLWPVACDVLCGGVAMESVRTGAKEVSERWLNASRTLKKEDQV